MPNPRPLPKDILNPLLVEHHGYWIFDLDGTLIELASQPGEVEVTQALLETLHSLWERAYHQVAIVSGRALKDLERLIPLPMTLVGNHGIEWRQDGKYRQLLLDPNAEDALTALREPLNALAQAMPGTYFENKTWTYSFHYRHLPQADWSTLEAQLRRMMAPWPSVRLSQAQLCWEIRPRQGVTKGDAVKMLLGDSDLIPVVLGDDLTDEDAFREASSGITIIVGPRRPTIAQYSLPSPRVVQEILRQLVL